jgi:hypothetical protein
MNDTFSLNFIYIRILQKGIIYKDIILWMPFLIILNQKF